MHNVMNNVNYTISDECGDCCASVLSSFAVLRLNTTQYFLKKRNANTINTAICKKIADLKTKIVIKLDVHFPGGK